jgi:AcrR family transcriptional regulator
MNVAHRAEDRHVRQIHQIAVDLHHLIDRRTDAGQRIPSIFEGRHRLGAKVAGRADDVAIQVRARNKLTFPAKRLIETRSDRLTRTTSMARLLAGRAAPHSADEQGTRDRILRTAERLFAERGFNGVSVRELATGAGVNIASIGYHFGNKEGLLSEVYRRHCEPMIRERLKRLEAALQLPREQQLAAIIEAFVRPALQQVEVEAGETFIRMRAVLSGENSELLEKLVAENFDQSSSAFIDALCELLPGLSRTDVCWRFHFLLGAIYYTAAGPHRIHAFSHGLCDPANTEAVIKELVPFMTRAFLGGPSETRPSRPRKAR